MAEEGGCAVVVPAQGTPWAGGEVLFAGGTDWATVRNCGVQCDCTALVVIGPLASPLEADCGPVEQRHCWRARCASSRLLRTLDSRGASTHPPHRIMHRSLGALSTSLRPTHRRVGTLPMSRAAQHGACAFRLFVIYLPAQIQPLHHCRRNWSGRKSIQTL